MQVSTENEFFQFKRKDRFFIVELKKAHGVLSSTHIHGGYTEHLSHVANHQACEGSGHEERHQLISTLGIEKYHQQSCAEAGLNPNTSALMSTAADMQYTSVVAESFGEDQVTVMTTAGVQGNAVCAGDTASWFEKDHQFYHISDANRVPAQGTINSMIFFNSSLPQGALVGACTTATEAKSAALKMLAIPSRYSNALATGTGTDQIVLAAPLNSAIARSSAGKHNKLGEILAIAVIKSIHQALEWQNGLMASGTRNLFHALGRFGINEENLFESLNEKLEAKDSELLIKNKLSLVHDPHVSGCAYAIAAVIDRYLAGALPIHTSSDLLNQQFALLASAIAAKPPLYVTFKAELDQIYPVHDLAKLYKPLATAITIGWMQKWS